MIVEERNYIIVPGRLPDYLEIYTDGPMQLQADILGGLRGYFTEEIGELSTLVSLWGYASLDDRAERRQQLAAVPEWQSYLKRCTPLIVRMTNRILVPTSFCPIGTAPRS